jgi:hypothetical protein
MRALGFDLGTIRASREDLSPELEKGVLEDWPETARQHRQAG